MSDAKVKIFKSNGELIGYFEEPKIISYSQGEYEISGQFFLQNGEPAKKLEFNPQAMPYIAELNNVASVPHKKLGFVYVQSGRQPMRFSAVLNAPATAY
jgi:hypothetical protein